MNKKEIISNIMWLIGVLLVVIFIKKFIFISVIVSGGSMDPTMEDRERVIALKRTEIERFDIVTFPAPDAPKKSYIKRVIGFPGETIEFRQDTLLIDGKEYKEPYLEAYKSKLGPDEYLTTVKDTEGVVHNEFDLANLFGRATVPEGQLFVLGDNRQVSKDSRMIGFINKKDISGDVVFSFWPPSKFGKVN